MKNFWKKRIAQRTYLSCDEMRREDSKTKRNEQFDCMYLLYCLKNTEKSGFWSSQSIISFKLQLQTSSEI